MEHERFILSLLQLPKVGRKSAWKILQTRKAIAKSASELFKAVSDAHAAPKVSKANAEDAWSEAEKILNRAKALRIHVIACTNEEFPAWLKSIPDPPLILFIKGDTSCITTPLGVAVIGTREPTEYGKEVAHRFGQRGAEAGCVIISGLALGCDNRKSVV